MTEPAPTLSNEQVALLIKNLWGALITPPWKKDDLIDLGKVVWSHTPINKLDDHLFSRLMPLLTQVALALSPTITALASSNIWAASFSSR